MCCIKTLSSPQLEVSACRLIESLQPTADILTGPTASFSFACASVLNMENVSEITMRLLRDQEALSAMLSLLDPRSLLRAEAVCTSMRSGALLAWPTVCARTWPHSQPKSAPAARAFCSAYGSSIMHPGGKTVRRVVAVPSLTFILQLSLDGELAYACTDDMLLTTSLSQYTAICPSCTDGSISTVPTGRARSPTSSQTWA